MKKFLSRRPNYFLALLSLCSIFFSLCIVKDFVFVKPSKKISTPPNSTGERLVYVDSTVRHVLGDTTGSIRIGKEGRYSYGDYGSLIALTSSEEPSLELQSWNFNGDVNISLYEVDKNFVLEYLVYDKDGVQTHRFPNLGSINRVYSSQKKIESVKKENEKLDLPLRETGAWYLKVSLGDKAVDDAVIIRSKTGLIVEEGNDEMIFWGQDFKSGRSIESGHLAIYHLSGGVKLLAGVYFDSSGIVKNTIDTKADIGVYEDAGDISVIPINLSHFGYVGYDRFAPKNVQSKLFLFTDRPLYKPGDKVYFKAIIRNEDDARFSIPSGLARVAIYKNWDERNTVFEKYYQITSDGTIDGNYTVPANQSTGYYTIKVSVGETSEYRYASRQFQIEYFRKPEYSIDVTTSGNEFVKGDDISFNIKGNYFSGQPLSGQVVKYRLMSNTYYDSWYYYEEDVNDDYRWGWWGGNEIKNGTVTLNEKGIATFDYQASGQGTYKPEVITFEAEYDNGSGNPSFARKNMIIYPALFGIYQDNNSYHNYSSKVGEEIEFPLLLVPKRGSNVSNIPLNVSMKREYWETYSDPKYKYPQYKEVTENFPESEIKTDDGGKAVVRFTPQKVGSFQILIKAKDENGNEIEKEFYLWVHSEEESYFDYRSQSDNLLKIQTDKSEYNFSDTMTVSIYSEIPDRDIFLSLDRARVNRYHVIKLEGKFANVEVPLSETDIPNIYLNAKSFSQNKLNYAGENIEVSTNPKKLIVSVAPNKSVFAPSEEVTVNISTTDFGGNPASSDIAIWAVDKAIFELVSENPLNITEAFWSKRYDDTESSNSLYGINSYPAAEMGGCFSGDTLISMWNGSKKEIKDIAIGDKITTFDGIARKRLVAGLVKGVSKEKVNGYYIINRNLKVTPEHRLWVNSNWKEVRSIELGDKLLDSYGNTLSVSSIEWVSQIVDVYNLTIEKYQTYFANGLWVHNEKGEGSARTVFEDTAYWNPSVHTDNSGHAQVKFKLPDNLTTWVIAAVGSTGDTKVGKQRKEIIVTKDVVIRPIVPNILRIDDEIILSGIVNNFSKRDLDLNVSLESDSVSLVTPKRFDLNIKSGMMDQVYWKIIPKKENRKAKIRFSAVSKNDEKNSDIVMQEIPIEPFGFWDKKGENGEGSKTFQVKLSSDANKEKSKVTLNLSSSLISSLVPGMKYLIGYPYGCVEQTTSKLVPAIIAKANSEIFADSMVDKKIDDIINTGINRLKELQGSDGGWGWWGGASDPFITSHVTEYLMMAKANGYEVDYEIISKLVSYLKRSERPANPSSYNNEFSQKEIEILTTYSLSLLGENEGKKKLSELTNLPTDILSVAVLSNVRNGYLDTKDNGVELLSQISKSQGDGIYWDKGSEGRFGSIDASTALAVRALVAGGGDKNLAVGGIRYLLRSRKLDYWSNSYATSSVIRAAVDYSKKIGEFDPDYLYEVYLDGKLLTKGSVTDANKVIKDIVIGGGSIKEDGSSIEVKKSGGSGELYTLLLIEDFLTNKEAKSEDHGLSVRREYVNTKGYEYGLGLGDEIDVKLSVHNPGSAVRYAIIADELPSGLIPINSSFKNEQFQAVRNYDYSSEITENGAVLSIYSLPGGTTTYSYKARVVSEGTFAVSPAYASLMYAPDVYGRSDAQLIAVEKEARIVRQKPPGVLVREAITQIAENRQKSRKTVLSVFIILALVLLVFIDLLFINRIRNTFIGNFLHKFREKITHRFGRKKDILDDHPDNDKTPPLE